MSELLPAFTCASAIGNLWRISLGVNILSPFLSVAAFFGFKNHWTNLMESFLPLKRILRFANVFFALQLFFLSVSFLGIY